jgi:hypothetical protein
MAIEVLLSTLKTTWTGSGRCLVFHTLCTSAAAQPMTSVSASESSRMPRSTKRKCTDMVLSMPGSLTFMVEARMAISR